MNITYGQPVEVENTSSVPAFLDGEFFATVEKTTENGVDLYTVHRNGIATDAMPREGVAITLHGLAYGIMLAVKDQQAAEAQGFEMLTVADLLDAEFGPDMWLL